MPVILQLLDVHRGRNGELVFPNDIYQKDETAESAAKPLESQWLV